MSSTFAITCPHCGQALEADETLVGQNVECPVCGNPFTVFAPEDPETGQTNGERVSAKLSEVSTDDKSVSDSVRTPNPPNQKLSFGPSNVEHRETPRIFPDVERKESPALVLPVSAGIRKRKTALWFFLGVLAVLGVVGSIFLFGSGSSGSSLSKSEQKQLWGFVLAATKYIETVPTEEAKSILVAACDGKDPATIEVFKDGLSDTVKVLEHGLKTERIDHVRFVASKLSPEFSKKADNGVFPTEFLADWNSLMALGDPNGEFVEIVDDARIDANGAGVLVKLFVNTGGFRDRCLSSAKSRDATCRDLIAKIRAFCLSEIPDKRETAFLENRGFLAINDPGREAREIEELLDLAESLFPTRANAFLVLNSAAGGESTLGSGLGRESGEHILATLKGEGLAFPGMARSLRRRLKGLLDEADSSGSLGRRILLDIIRAKGLSSRKKPDPEKQTAHGRRGSSSRTKEQATHLVTPYFDPNIPLVGDDKVPDFGEDAYRESEYRARQRYEQALRNTSRQEGSSSKTAEWNQALSSFSNGLVLWFDFDDMDAALKDRSGRGNNGEVVGARWDRVPRHGGNGQFQFDGLPEIEGRPDLTPDEAHDFIRIRGNPSGFPVDDFTISVVCSPENDGAIVGSGENEMWPRQWQLRSDRFGWTWVPGHASGGIGSKSRELHFPDSKGTIQHLVISRHKQTVVVFRNGRLLAKDQFFPDMPLPVYSYGLFFGNQELDEHTRWRRWNRMKGSIGHVMIWNRFLKTEEIDSLWKTMQKKYMIPSENRTSRNDDDSVWN